MTGLFARKRRTQVVTGSQEVGTLKRGFAPQKEQAALGLSEDDVMCFPSPWYLFDGHPWYRFCSSSKASVVDTSVLVGMNFSPLP